LVIAGLYRTLILIGTAGTGQSAEPAPLLTLGREPPCVTFVRSKLCLSCQRPDRACEHYRAARLGSASRSSHLLARYFGLLNIARIYDLRRDSQVHAPKGSDRIFSIRPRGDCDVSSARRGGPSLVGGSLFTTTFPCHNCARHIVAAGIKRVLYIEPYEKSLALELHDDAIVSDTDGDSESRVRFMHFEGVAPRQYQQLFAAKGERKKDGISP
jgi:deoxycytidylate deaminase